MKSKWQVMSNFIPGVGKVYRAYRLLDTERPKESGNLEGYGEYSEDRDAVQETVDMLNAMEDQESRRDVFPAQTCPVCGREFVPTPEWHWEESGVKFCRYNCYLKRAPIIEAKRKRARSYRSPGAVCKYRADGTIEAIYGDLEDAARAAGLPKNVLRAYCKSGVKNAEGAFWKFKEVEEDTE